MNTITPETERTSHYFWAFMRNYRLDSQLITTQLREGVRNVFAEDEAMLAAQQAAIDANPDHEFYSLNIDAGGMWVRRILDRMLEAEDADPRRTCLRTRAMTTQSLPDWSTGRVVASTPVAHDVRRITIARPAARPGRAGQPRRRPRPPRRRRTDVRSYSVVESDDDGGLLTISVLRVPQSRGGSAFMHGLEPGDELAVTQPLQNFPLRVGAPRYVLLAGGIGITAVAEMARVLRHVGADYTLVYVGRGRERMAYVVELAELHGDRLVLHVDAEGSPLDVAELVRSVDAQTELYMCGPIRLMDAVRRNWHDAGLPPANLRYETFGSSGWFEPEEFVVRVPQRQVETTVRTDETLLEALTRAGRRPDVRLPQGRVRAVPPRRRRRGRHPRPPRRLPQRRPAGQRPVAARPASRAWPPARDRPPGRSCR